MRGGMRDPQKSNIAGFQTPASGPPRGDPDTWKGDIG